MGIIFKIETSKHESMDSHVCLFEFNFSDSKGVNMKFPENIASLAAHPISKSLSG